MPKCSLTAKKSQSKATAKKVMVYIKALKQVDIARELNESPQKIFYRIHNVYPKLMPEMVMLLDMAGLEIVEKGEEE